MGRARSSAASGVLLGHLDSLIVTNGSSDRSVAGLSGLFVAWMPKTRDLAIVRRAGARAVGSVDAESLRIFRKFHAGESRRTGGYEWPEQSGSLRCLGRLRTLAYVVPTSIPSPQKRGFRWVHEFGDHGERGHGEHDGKAHGYPVKYMPKLFKDSAGNFFIKRQPGNKYYVEDWLYW